MAYIKTETEKSPHDLYAGLVEEYQCRVKASKQLEERVKNDPELVNFAREKKDYRSYRDTKINGLDLFAELHLSDNNDTGFDLPILWSRLEIYPESTFFDGKNVVKSKGLFLFSHYWLARKYNSRPGKHIIAKHPKKGLFPTELDFSALWSLNFYEKSPEEKKKELINAMNMFSNVPEEVTPNGKLWSQMSVVQDTTTMGTISEVIQEFNKYVLEWLET